MNLQYAHNNALKFLAKWMLSWLDIEEEKKSWHFTKSTFFFQRVISQQGSIRCD